MADEEKKGETPQPVMPRRRVAPQPRPVTGGMIKVVAKRPARIRGRDAEGNRKEYRWTKVGEVIEVPETFKARIIAEWDNSLEIV